MPSFLNDLLGGISGLLHNLLSAVLPLGIVQFILALVGIGVAVTFVALVVMSQVWSERKLIARIQDRVGPNRVGPWDIFQSVADVLKLLTKEDIVPAQADRWVFVLAP